MKENTFFVLNELVSRAIDSFSATALYEYVAALSGIISVYFSKRENVLVYPVGLIGTAIYVFISLQANLPGEAAVNFYYTVMSLIGWAMWSKRDRHNNRVLLITFSSRQDLRNQVLFFAVIYAAVFAALSYFKQEAFFPGALPVFDGFATATAFTGMWLMTRKKVESWHWWIATNIASVPLYFIKGYIVTSVYYLILLAMACAGLANWRKAAKTATHGT